MDSPPDPVQWFGERDKSSSASFSLCLTNARLGWMTARIPSCLGSFDSMLAQLLKESKIWTR